MDVRRTEEFAYETNCPQITQNDADEMLNVVICVNLRDLRASPFDFQLRYLDIRKCAHRLQTLTVCIAERRRTEWHPLAATSPSLVGEGGRFLSVTFDVECKRAAN